MFPRNTILVENFHEKHALNELKRSKSESQFDDLKFGNSFVST